MIAHVHVVHDDRQVIRREAVGPEDHEVLEAAVVEADLAMDGVGKRGATLRRHAEANGPRRTGSFQRRYLIR